MNEYPVHVMQRIRHIKDDVEGIVLSIDTNLPHPTTCRVLWDDSSEEDIQWTNKIVPAE